MQSKTLLAHFPIFIHQMIITSSHGHGSQNKVPKGRACTQILTRGEADKDDAKAQHLAAVSKPKNKGRLDRLGGHLTDQSVSVSEGTGTAATRATTTPAANAAAPRASGWQSVVVFSPSLYMMYMFVCDLL